MGKKELGNKKTPAYAVLITILNLFNKWVPVLFVSGFLPPRPAEQGGHAHRKQVLAPGSKCWLKNK